MDNRTENLENKLTVLVDYMAFTITAQNMDVNDVIEFMGFAPHLFEDMPKGANGYKRMKKCSLNGISVLYDGTDDMGIHVNVTGQGISSLLDAFMETFSSETPFGKGYSLWQETVLSRFCADVLEVGQFTRIDIAIDDYGMNYYSPDELDECWHNDKIVTKFRSEYIHRKSDAPRNCSGRTVYFGSRTSSLMLRVYDKKLEQNTGLKPTDDNYIDMEWIRWELEFKNERANDLAKQFIDNIPLGQVAVGVLHYYFRIIQFDDSNRSRCSNDEKWDNFINGIKKLRICMRKQPKTLYEKERWIDDQVAPSLALLLIMNDGDTNYLNNIALKALPRLSNADKEILRTERPDTYKHFFGEITE